MARQLFASERSDAIENAQLAGNYSDRDHAAYLDRLAQWNADRSFGYNVLQDVIQNSRYAREYQDTKNAAQYEREQAALKAQQEAEQADATSYYGAMALDIIGGASSRAQALANLNEAANMGILSDDEINYLLTYIQKTFTK